MEQSQPMKATVVRFWAILILVTMTFVDEPMAQLAPGPESTSKRLDCSSLSGALAQVVCANAIARAAVEKHRLTFEERRELTSPMSVPGDNPFPDLDGWGAMIKRECGEPARDATTDNRFISCVIKAFEARAMEDTAWILNSRVKLPRMSAQVAPDEVARSACARALNFRYDVVRYSSEGYPMSDIVPHDPERFSEWPYKAFDSGEGGATYVRLRPGEDPVPVIEMHEINSYYSYQWYVIPERPEEAETWWRRLNSRGQHVDVGEFARQMRHPTHAPKPVSPNTATYTPGSTAPSAPALYDAANTLQFMGHEVYSELIAIDGIGYVRATRAVAAGHIPDAALFRFGADGELETLCWEKL